MGLIESHDPLKAENFLRLVAEAEEEGKILEIQNRTT